MHRSLFLCLAFFLASLPASAQTASTDSQTLQALLAEVRQLRQDLQTTSLASLRAQILLHRLQAQEAVVARATERVDDAHKKLSDQQNANKNVAAGIKRSEDFVNNSDNPEADRKQMEDSLPARKARLESGEALEQDLQTRAIEAEEQLRMERAKLDALEDQLDRLEKALDNFGRSPERTQH